MTTSAAEVARLTVRIGEADLTLRDLRSGDASAVLTLHEQVFGAGVDARWFAWKYEQDSGQGQGQALGAWSGDTLIAYCGGLPRTLWQQGKTLRALQMGDVMVHPAWRGILTRRGPFFHVTREFHSSRVGATPQHPFALGFGFPNLRHLRLGAMLGLMHDDGVMESLHWNTTPSPAPGLPWSLRWREVAASGTDLERSVNSAWQAMRAQASELTLGQRDGAYMRWRYIDRPTPPDTRDTGMPRYRFFELHRLWSHAPLGVAVLDLRTPSAHWLDWIGPVQWLAVACRACRLEAARAGATTLTAWASRAVAGALENSDIVRREPCAGLAISTASDLGAQSAVGLNWWLMGGDTDFL